MIYWLNNIKSTAAAKRFSYNLEDVATTGITEISCNFKGAMRFGTFKSIDFKKNWYVKVPVVPRSLML